MMAVQSYSLMLQELNITHMLGVRMFRKTTLLIQHPLLLFVLMETRFFCWEAVFLAETIINSSEPEQILREVIEQFTPRKANQFVNQTLWQERVRRLRPLLAYAFRLQWKAGLTLKSEDALRQFAHSYLSGEIPLFD
jgi:hypothetical protein